MEANVPMVLAWLPELLQFTVSILRIRASTNVRPGTRVSIAVASVGEPYFVPANSQICPTHPTKARRKILQRTAKVTGKLFDLPKMKAKGREMRVDRRSP
nr:hypothetical protein Iba_chr07dCG11130 [Ipomoea batatas]